MYLIRYLGFKKLNKLTKNFRQTINLRFLKKLNKKYKNQKFKSKSILTNTNKLIKLIDKYTLNNKLFKIKPNKLKLHNLKKNKFAITSNIKNYLMTSFMKPQKLKKTKTKILFKLNKKKIKIKKLKKLKIKKLIFKKVMLKKLKIKKLMRKKLKIKKLNLQLKKIHLKLKEVKNIKEEPIKLNLKIKKFDLILKINKLKIKKLKLKKIKIKKIKKFKIKKLKTKKIKNKKTKIKKIKIKKFKIKKIKIKKIKNQKKLKLKNILKLKIKKLMFKKLKKLKIKKLKKKKSKKKTVILSSISFIFKLLKKLPRQIQHKFLSNLFIFYKNFIKKNYKVFYKLSYLYNLNRNIFFRRNFSYQKQKQKFKKFFDFKFYKKHNVVLLVQKI